MSNKDPVVSVRFAIPNLRILNALARIENKYVGELIRTAVQEYIDKKISDPKTQEAIRKARIDFDLMVGCLINPVCEKE